MTVQNILMALCQAHPALTVDGLNPERLQSHQLRPSVQFQQSREALLSYAAAFIEVVAWLERNRHAQTSSVNRLATSYNWKHVAEKAIKQYVPNGVLIAAALQVGLQFEHIEDTDTVHLNLSQEFLQIQRLILTPCEVATLD